MARIRTIKPEFWQNEELAELCAETRLLAIGLLNIADDEGFFKAHASLVKSSIFPFSDDSLNVHGMLISLSKTGYISLYEDEKGKLYGEVVNFNKHQVVNRPKPSCIKGLHGLTDYSLKEHGVLIAGKEGKGRERKGKEGKGGREKSASDFPAPAKSKQTSNSTLVFQSYVTGMKNRYGQNSQPARNAKINKLLNNMIERIGLDNAITVALHYPQHQKSWYVTKAHAIDFMVQDCEQLLTQVQSGMMITTAHATKQDRQGEFKQSLAQVNLSDMELF